MAGQADNMMEREGLAIRHCPRFPAEIWQPASLAVISLGLLQTGHCMRCSLVLGGRRNTQTRIAQLPTRIHKWLLVQPLTEGRCMNARHQAAARMQHIRQTYAATPQLELPAAKLSHNTQPAASTHAANCVGATCSCLKTRGMQPLKVKPPE